VLEDLRRLDSAGVRLLTVPGNHDEYSYPRCVYRAYAGKWPGTLVQSPLPALVDRWELSGRTVDLYAMAYVAGRSREPYDRFPVEATPHRKIAVIHGSLDAPWSDRSVPLKSEALASLGLDYIALGHLHKPEGSGFDDPGGAELVSIDLAADSLRPQRRTWPSRRIASCTLNVSAMSREEELLAQIDEIADDRAIVRLSLTGVPGFDLDPERCRRKRAERFFHLEVEASETIPSGLLQGISEERTARGAFARLAREKIAAASGDAERALREAALRHGLAAFAAGQPAEALAGEEGNEA
jgi:hypothetical protein